MKKIASQLKRLEKVVIDDAKTNRFPAGTMKPDQPVKPVPAVQPTPTSLAILIDRLQLLASENMAEIRTLTKRVIWAIKRSSATDGRETFMKRFTQ